MLDRLVGIINITCIKTSAWKFGGVAISAFCLAAVSVKIRGKNEIGLKCEMSHS